MKYEEAALLINGDGGALAGLLHVSTDITVTAYQYAIWSLFTPSAGSYGNSATLQATALADVNSGQSKFQAVYNQLRIYTADPKNSNQEFLQIASGVTVPPANTPEPITMLLSGAGLVGLALVGRKRNAAK